MACQTVGARKTVVTNLLILAAIAAVCFLSFQADVLKGLSMAVNAPVFAGSAGKGAVALEIALCVQDDARACMRALRAQGAGAALFACPALLRKDAGLLESMEEAGFEAGVYDCGKHAPEGGFPEGRPLLCDYGSDANLFAAFSQNRRVCWTLDADLLIAADGTGKAFADALREGAIVLHRFRDVSGLEAVVARMRAKGYTITGVNSIAPPAP